MSKQGVFTPSASHTSATPRTGGDPVRSAGSASEHRPGAGLYLTREEILQLLQLWVEAPADALAIESPVMTKLTNAAKRCSVWKI